MAFLKFSIVMAVLVSAYAAPQYHHAPPPPPPPPAVYRSVAPPPPPPAYHAVQPYHAAQQVHIVSQSYDANPDGAYTFSYESGDGSARQEQGIPKSPPGHEGPGGIAVQGRYVYQSPEGPIEVQYIADENGFQPSGNDIHPEIVKAVAAQVAQARAEGPAAYNAPPPPPPPAVYAKAAYPQPVPVAYPTPVAFPPPSPAYPYKA